MKKRAEDLLEASLKDLTLEEEVAAKGAITELFPRLRAVLNGQTFTARAEEFLAKQKKLASEEYFDRYFTYCVPKHDFSDQDVISLVNDSDSSMSNLDTILGKISEESSEAFLMKLSRFSNNALPAVASNLAIVLARRAKLFERLHENRLIRVSGRTATQLLYQTSYYRRLLISLWTPKEF
jgi:hypothetical protein